VRDQVLDVELVYGFVFLSGMKPRGQESSTAEIMSCHMVVMKLMDLANCLKKEYLFVTDFTSIVTVKFLFGNPTSFIVTLRHSMIDMQSVWK
jgi:hypothetical protein